MESLKTEILNIILDIYAILLKDHLDYVCFGVSNKRKSQPSRTRIK